MVHRQRVGWLVTSLLITVSASVPVAAAELVAMRVEVQPVRAVGGETVTAVEIQVAPEDRVRVGRNAWVEMELRRGQSVLSSSARAVEVDGEGRMRLETSWPAGSFDLRVEIQGQSGAGGFWVGRVTVPAAVVDETAPDVSPADAPSEPAEDDEPVAAAPDAAAAAESEERPSETAAGRSAAGTAPEVAPVGAATAWPEMDPGALEITAMVLDRNQPVTGLDVGDFRTLVLLPFLEQFPNDFQLTNRWYDQTFVSMAVPQNDIDFRLLVDGDDVALLRAGGVGDAGLWMAVAVDLSASMEERLPEVRDLIGRLSLQADAGLSLLTAAPEVARVLEWGASPSAMSEALLRAGAAGDGDLAELAATALQALTDRPGRRLLVLVTDGGDRSSKDDWKRAEETAGEAGVPTLLLAYRTDRLENRTRRSLERMVEVSGGKSYVIRPRDTGLLKLVGDHFGELAKASYAMRFVPPGDGGLHRIKLATGGGLEVLHPETVR